MKRKLFDSARAYLSIAVILAGLLLVLSAVLTNSRDKPKSPQAMVAAAINGGLFTPREWKPGMGPQPFIYHPAAIQGPAWQPLPDRDMPSGGASFMQLERHNVMAGWRSLPSGPIQERLLDSVAGTQSDVRIHTGLMQ